MRPIRPDVGPARARLAVVLRLAGWWLAVAADRVDRTGLAAAMAAHPSNWRRTRKGDTP